MRGNSPSFCYHHTWLKIQIIKKKIKIKERRMQLRFNAGFIFTMICFSLVVLNCTVWGCCLNYIHYIYLKNVKKIKKKHIFRFFFSPLLLQVDLTPHFMADARLTDFIGYKPLSFSQYCWSIVLINKWISKDIFYSSEWKTCSWSVPLS